MSEAARYQHDLTHDDPNWSHCHIYSSHIHIKMNAQKKKIRINREKRKANIPNEILSYVYSFICVSAFPYE